MQIVRPALTSLSATGRRRHEYRGDQPGRRSRTPHLLRCARLGRNALGARVSALVVWHRSKPLTARCPDVGARAIACAAAGSGRTDVEVCERASIGHPNSHGAAAYASEILAVLNRTTFPQNFLWGVATAGKQVEGGITGDDWEFLLYDQCHDCHSHQQSPTKPACRHWI